MKVTRTVNMNDADLAQAVTDHVRHKLKLPDHAKVVVRFGSTERAGVESYYAIADIDHPEDRTV